MLLAVLLVCFINPDPGLFGVTHEDALHIRVSMVVCAAWMLVFTLPILVLSRNRAPTGAPSRGVFGAYADLVRSVRRLWATDRSVVWFLVSSAVFRDGLAGIFAFGGVLAGVAFGFSESMVLAFGVAANLVAGLATVAFGLLGLLQARQLGRVTGFGVMVTSGTLLAAIGFNQPTVTGGALYYLLSSTMAAGAMFLLIELIDRSRLLESEFPNPDDADPVPFFLDEIEPPRDTNLDEQQEALTGRVIPASTAFLGFSFLACTLLLTGTPPLSGFIGKFMMLSGLLSTEEAGSALQEPVSTAAWVMLALVIMSGFAALVALSRTGIRMFWTPRDRPAAQLKVLECLPIGLLLTLCLLISFRAEPLARYLQAAASELKDPHGYVQAVQGVRPLPPPSVTRRILRQGIPLLKDDGEDTP